MSIYTCKNAKTFFTSSCSETYVSVYMYIEGIDIVIDMLQLAHNLAKDIYLYTM